MRLRVPWSSTKGGVFMKILLFMVLSVGMCAGCGGDTADSMEPSVGGQAIVNV